MSVPKAAVDEDDCAVFGEDDIGRSGQFLVVYLVAESLAPEGMTQTKLRAGILCSVMRHTFETLLWCHWNMDYNANLRRFN